MTYENVKNTALLNSISNVIGDLTDLFQKEIRLAGAEVSAKALTNLQGAAWMGAAAGLGLIAFLLTVEAIVFAIVSVGIAAYWSCLIVGAVFAAAGAFAFYKGRVDVSGGLTPNRTIHQLKEMKETVRITKEQVL